MDLKILGIIGLLKGGAVVKLLKVEIPKSKLVEVPEKERLFFVQIGNLLSDLSILQKLTIFSTNERQSNNVMRMAQNLQTLSLLRIQTGILWEGWQLLQKKFFGSGLSKKYEPLLDEKARKGLEALKEYFNRRGGLFKFIRTNFAFHYHLSSEPLKELIDEAPDSEIFEIYMSDFFGNCVFSMSNVLATFAILKFTDISNTDGAMRRFLQDITKVTGWFGDFLGGCVLIFATKHLGLDSSEVEIPEPPDVNTVSVPYFIKGEAR